MSEKKEVDVEMSMVSKMAALSISPVKDEDLLLRTQKEYEIVALMSEVVTKEVSMEDIRREFQHSKVELLSSLRIGDCIWVARRLVFTIDDTKDNLLVLPFIAFKDDGLLQEKSRLECQKYGFSKVLRIKETSVSPLTNSVHVRYNIHRIGEFHYFETVTGSPGGTLRYLADLTFRLNKSFQEKDVIHICRERTSLPALFSTPLKTIPFITWN